MLRRTCIVALSLIFLTVLAPSALALPAFQGELPCEDNPECYPPPEETLAPEPPPEETAIPDSPPSESSWEGYSDLRLNPQMDEYYSVYCKHDVVEVWGISSTNAQLISRIPIRSLIEGPFPFDGGNGLTVNRSGDTITIPGANGYGPNHPGSKSFSLAECIARNGGEPAAEATNEVILAPQGDGSTQETNGDGDDSATCKDPDYLLAHADECLKCFTPNYRMFPECSPDEQTSYQRLFSVLIGVCVNHPIGIGAVVAFAALRRRRRH